MNKENKNYSLHITKEAEGTALVDCDIESVKNEGKGTLMLRTRVFNFRKNHSTIWKTIIIGVISAIIAGLIILAIEYKLFIN